MGQTLHCSYVKYFYVSLKKKLFLLSIILSATSPQESLIVALATENPLQKSVTAAAITTNGAVVTQETPSSSTTLHSATAAAVAAATTVPLQPTIPQDITTMSDQDLISYINPSTFDQSKPLYTDSDQYFDSASF